MGEGSERRVHFIAALIYGADIVQHRDILRDIALNQYKVGGISFRDKANVITDTKEIRAVLGGALQGLYFT